MSYDFLEASGVITPVRPEPTPVEIARQFLDAIGNALQSGAYYLRPVFHTRVKRKGIQLGYFTDDSLVVSAGIARSIYAEAIGATGSLDSVSRSLWPALEAAGLGCQSCIHVIDGRNCRIRRLNRAAINQIMAEAPAADDLPSKD